MKIHFTPEKSLFSLPIVIAISIITTFISAIMICTIAYNMATTPWDFTGSGFNVFAEAYKVPATILAIGFTLIGLCAANHRSEQTKKQIERTSLQITLSNSQLELAKKQNNFSNHYKHLEEFEKFLKKIYDNEVLYLDNRKKWFEQNKLFSSLAKNAQIGPHIDIERYRDVYNDIYPQSKNGDFQCSKIYQERLNSFVLEILNIHSNILTKNPTLLGDNILKLHELTRIFKEENHIDIPQENTSFVTISKNRIPIPLSNFKYLFIEAFNAALLIIKLLSFDTDYKKPLAFQKISKLTNPQSLPDLETEEYDERSSVFREKGVTPENLFQ